MSAQFTSGPTAGQIGHGPVKRAAVWIVIGALVLMFLIGWAGYKLGHPQESGKGKSIISNTSSQSQQSSPTSGVVEVDDVKWVGKVLMDSTKRLDARLVQPNDTYWQVRMDRNDQRIHTLFPNNAPDDRHLEITLGSWNVMEWRILPGQPVKKGTVAWVISPR